METGAKITPNKEVASGEICLLFINKIDEESKKIHRKCKETNEWKYNGRKCT